MKQSHGSINYISAILVLWCFCVISLTVQGQISRPGRPYLPEYNGSPSLKVYDLMVTKEQKIKALAMDQDSTLKFSKSGLLIDVFYAPENSGTWDTLTDGTKIWRLHFESGGHQ
jgi:hypothetical protein